MSKNRENIPNADMLMGSMRSMGYSFESAIADIIDNSISAKCSYIKILFPTNPMEKYAVGILDNGIGMDEETLFEAMRYGSSAEAERDSTDLGRFGLGLKAASLSQCRVLTVISKKNGQLNGFVWDYDYIISTKQWSLLQLDNIEINNVPFFDSLDELYNGTLVVWQDFDVLAKSSDGQIYESLDALKSTVGNYLSLIFHRYISNSNKLKIYVNHEQLKPQDPFLESHNKTTTKKERTIALRDSQGIERLIKIKPFILPFATDLSDKDKKLLGGIENLRSKQGFYIYRNDRLIIWGTWFGMKPRSELTKNARIRVDIPNSLDDIWSIDIKKQSATIPKRIQNQLKNTVNEALEISVNKQVHRGRKNNIDDKIDYIWDRNEGRDNMYYYTVNRESNLYKYVKSKMSEEDYIYLEMLIGEIEKNIPTQQMYIDKSNEAIMEEEVENRFGDVYQIAVTLLNSYQSVGNSHEESINIIMNSEPFCNFPKLKEKLTEL